MKIRTAWDVFIVRTKASWFGIKKKNNSIVLDAVMIGMGTFLLGMAKPALVILSIVAIFSFSTWFIPRLGEWFNGAGIAVCAGIAALFILKGAPVLNALLVGTLLGSIALIVIGNILVRNQRRQRGSFVGEMATLQEVAGDDK